MLWPLLVPGCPGGICTASGVTKESLTTSDEEQKPRTGTCLLGLKQLEGISFAACDSYGCISLCAVKQRSLYMYPTRLQFIWAGKGKLGNLILEHLVAHTVQVFHLFILISYMVTIIFQRDILPDSEYKDNQEVKNLPSNQRLVLYIPRILAEFDFLI